MHCVAGDGAGEEGELTFVHLWYRSSTNKGEGETPCPKEALPASEATASPTADPSSNPENTCIACCGGRVGPALRGHADVVYGSLCAASLLRVDILVAKPSGAGRQGIH